MNTGEKDYSAFDRPEVSRFLFHPRPEGPGSYGSNAFKEISIPVEGEISIGGRFYPSEKNSPVLVFFHGNGEIVADYDDIAQLYQRMNINFIPVDYRGYGKSNGSPTVSTMIEDSAKIFRFIKAYLKEEGYEGALIVMGRSLGSAAALELVEKFGDEIDGLIIESGFAFAVPLLRLLGINVEQLGLKESQGFENAEKIKSYNKPTLIIHAEHDHIIPYSDGETLYQNSPFDSKKLLKIPGANHNDILARGLEAYMREVKVLVEQSIKEKLL